MYRANPNKQYDIEILDSFFRRERAKVIKNVKILAIEPGLVVFEIKNEERIIAGNFDVRIRETKKR